MAMSALWGPAQYCSLTATLCLLFICCGKWTVKWQRTPHTTPGSQDQNWECLTPALALGSSWVHAAAGCVTCRFDHNTKKGGKPLETTWSKSLSFQLSK